MSNSEEEFEIVVDAMVKSDIIIGRLKKKIEKLKKQRDFFKAQADRAEKILTTYPYIRAGYNIYEKRMVERDELNRLKLMEKHFFKTLEEPKP